MKQKYKKLKKLVIRACNELTDATFHWIAKAFNNITTLGIYI